MRLGFDEPPHCPPFWEAQRTYTAVHTDGCLGSSITVTRRYRSHQSMRHAEDVAHDLAKCEALAAMASYLRTQTVCPGITVNYFDNCPPPPQVQLAPALNLVVEAGEQPGDFEATWTNPPFIPFGMKLNLTEGFEIEQIFTEGETSYSATASPGAAIVFTLINYGTPVDFIDSDAVTAEFENP